MGIIDTPMNILQIIYQLISRFDTREDRYEILKKAIENSKRSLNILVSKVSIEDELHGKYDSKSNPDPEERWIVDSNQI